jgi:hypothetical protein
MVEMDDRERGEWGCKGTSTYDTDAGAERSWRKVHSEFRFDNPRASMRTGDTPAQNVQKANQHAIRKHQSQKKNERKPYGNGGREGPEELAKRQYSAKKTQTYPQITRTFDPLTSLFAR